MADHKIDGNDGAGNVQAPERIWASNRTNGNCVVSFTSRSEEYSIEYICADRFSYQLAAANARADAARDAALVEAAKNCNDRGVREQENYGLNRATQNYFRARDTILALRDKPAPRVDGWQPIETAPAVLPLLPDMVDAATAAGVVVWWDNEAQKIKMAVTVQEAAKVLLDAFMRKDIDPLDAVDPQIEALAIKHSGNRGDPVIQLEIAEEFFCAALRSIAPPEA